MLRLGRFLDAPGQLRALLRANAAIPSEVKALREAVEEHRRETRVLLGALSLPPAEQWRGRPALHPETAPAASAFPYSTLCRQDSFEAPYFSYWASRLGTVPRYHRKLWEFVFICQALHERGALTGGAHGLGFGVGREPLTALFAAQECKVLATDMAALAAEQAGWSLTAQHAHGIEGLRVPWICPDDMFDRNVRFRTCDMNAISPELKGFDFCWSACALEHLGSIEAGLTFIEASLACLRPGGWAVHTTEFNLNSNEDTVEDGPTVIFRRRDLEELASRLGARGHKVAPFDFDPGDGPMDRYIDVPPYRQLPVLKLLLSGYAATSFGVIVQRSA